MRSRTPCSLSRVGRSTGECRSTARPASQRGADAAGGIWMLVIENDHREGRVHVRYLARFADTCWLGVMFIIVVKCWVQVKVLRFAALSGWPAGSRRALIAACPCLVTSLPLYIPIALSSCLSSYLPSYLPVYLSTYPPTSHLPISPTPLAPSQLGAVRPTRWPPARAPSNKSHPPAANIVTGPYVHWGPVGGALAVSDGQRAARTFASFLYINSDIAGRPAKSTGLGCESRKNNTFTTISWANDSNKAILLPRHVPASGRFDRDTFVLLTS